MTSAQRRGVGPSRRIPSSSTTTSSTRVDTSRRGNSRSSSAQRFARVSDRSASKGGGQETTRRGAMKSGRILVAVVVASLAVAVLAAMGGRAVFAQDAGQAKYSVRVPNGLAFSEFKGYESWQTISISDSGKHL